MIIFQHALPFHIHHLTMADISSLPVEILRYCVNYLDTAALREIRLTSRALRDVATEALFGEATIRPDAESKDKFTALFESREFRRCIHSVSVSPYRTRSRLETDGSRSI